MKYLLWNKALDYQRGRMEGVAVTGRELHLDYAAGGDGVFVSRMMDGREKQTVWHRMVTDICLGENIAVQISLFATDSVMEAQGIEELLDLDDGSTLEEKTRRMEQIRQMTVRNPEDILLHQVCGRYLWMKINLWGNGEAGPVIRMIQIYFPKETWNRYLPEIYQGRNQEFLERFLAIFQSIYQDMDHKIRKDLQWMDIDAAGDDQLQWLADWIHARNSHLWEPDRLRSCLAGGAAVFRGLGTPRCLIRLVEIFTGEHPYLKEAQDGEDYHSFTLYIREAVIADVRRYRALLQIIEDSKPADMTVKLVPLKPFLFLDQNTYLGINSRLGQYGAAVIGTRAAFDFVVLGGANEESDIHAI